MSKDEVDDVEEAATRHVDGKSNVRVRFQAASIHLSEQHIQLHISVHRQCVSMTDLLMSDRIPPCLKFGGFSVDSVRYVYIYLISYLLNYLHKLLAA